jgi:hypothetical protein
MKTPGKLPVWLSRTLLVAAALCIVVVAGWYSPIITASIWHVLNPRGWVRYRGLSVRVPFPWIADNEVTGEDPSVTPEGLALRKLPPTMVHRPSPQSMFVTVISPDPGVTAEQQTEQWMKMFRETHPGAEFEAATSVAIPAGASCLRATNSSKPNDVVWTCISVGQGWVANFEGHRRDEPAFFEVIEELKR